MLVNNRYEDDSKSFCTICLFFGDSKILVNVYAIVHRWLLMVMSIACFVKTEYLS